MSEDASLALSPFLMDTKGFRILLWSSYWWRIGIGKDLWGKFKGIQEVKWMMELKCLGSCLVQAFSTRRCIGENALLVRIPRDRGKRFLPWRALSQLVSLFQALPICSGRDSVPPRGCE